MGDLSPMMFQLSCAVVDPATESTFLRGPFQYVAGWYDCKPQPCTPIAYLIATAGMRFAQEHSCRDCRHWLAGLRSCARQWREACSPPEEKGKPRRHTTPPTDRRRSGRRKNKSRLKSRKKTNQENGSLSDAQPWALFRRPVATDNCPGGATENSPAFQRWVNAIREVPSPAGTADVLEIARAMTVVFFRPSGTRSPFARIPTVETVGYCRASLRDEGGAR